MADDPAASREVHSTWQKFIRSVIDANIDAFSNHIATEDYIAHMGAGQIEHDRQTRLDTVAAIFSQSASAGDDEALLDRRDTVEILSDDLALCQHTCLIRDANTNYALSALLKRHGDDWKIIHTHESFG